MAVVGSIKVNIKPVKAIMKSHGLDTMGAVQQHHTQNVLHRIVRYMPYRTGLTIKQTEINSPISGNAINTFEDYARFLHEGKLMVDPVTGAAGFMTEDGWRSRKNVKKVESNRPITYTQSSKSPKAGPYWGRRLMAEEGDAMLQDLKNFVRRREMGR